MRNWFLRLSMILQSAGLMGMQLPSAPADAASRNASNANAGCTPLHQGIDVYQAIGYRGTQTRYLCVLAEAYGKTGQKSKGLTIVEEALALVAQTGERFYEAELYRIKGELLLQRVQAASSKPQMQHRPKSKLLKSSRSQS